MTQQTNELQTRFAQTKSMSGSKAFQGSRAAHPSSRAHITVHAIEARLLNGDCLDDIAAKNPDVPREAFVAAVQFAKAHPLPG